MVAGNTLLPPQTPFDSARPITANIAIEIKETVTGSLHWSSLFFLGLILFIFLFSVNLFTEWLIHKK